MNQRFRGNQGHWPARPTCACPLCGYNYSAWSLVGQYAHLNVSHTWWERLKLWWRVGSLRRMVIARKYGDAS